MTSRPGWLARYLAGDTTTVWEELRLLGPHVRDPRAAGEVQAVCDEMARRTRHNLEVLIDRLATQGYVFHDNTDAAAPVEPLVGPAPDAEDLVAWLEDTFDHIPMVLSSWVRIVGDVWLMGTHPHWEHSGLADPLVVEVAGTRYAGHDVRSYYLEQYEDWAEGDKTRPFQLPIAPDVLHKNNISGGDPYGLIVPGAGADAVLVTATSAAHLASTTTSFVSYLQQAFRTGGFPGPQQAGEPKRPHALIAELAAGLQPI